MNNPQRSRVDQLKFCTSWYRFAQKSRADSFSLRPSVYFCGLCVEMTVKRRECRDRQRTAEKTPSKTHFLCKASWYVSSLFYYSTKGRSEVLI